MNNFNRYTFRDSDGTYFVNEADYYVEDDYYTGDAIERLAKYEDSTLLPEQVMLVKTIVDSTFGDTSFVEHIRKLLKADREGRLIIVDNTPHQISSCDTCESGWGTATATGYDSCFNHCEKLAEYRKQEG
jgi:16S rRNA C1402 N4-methylase RsmH